MTETDIRRLALDIIEDLCADYPDFTSEHVEEVVRNVVACDGLSPEEEAVLRDALCEFGAF